MKILILSFLAISMLLLIPACSEPLDLTVNPIPTEIDTNIPKISGKVSDPKASVHINVQKATVLGDGSFFAYLEVQPRVATKIEIRAESSGRTASKSLTTTFYPEPMIWIFGADTHSSPERIDGWISYPDAQIEATGDLKNPVVEMRNDGYFAVTLNLFKGQATGPDTFYSVTLQANTSRGPVVSNFGTYKALGERPTETPPDFPVFRLDSGPAETKVVHVVRGKTALLDSEFSTGTTSPTTIDLKLTPDLSKGVIPDNLDVSIEPKSFLAYPKVTGNSTIIIRAGEGVPAGSYFFRANIGDHLEVVVD
jgi:hypothetical protein